MEVADGGWRWRLQMEVADGGWRWSWRWRLEMEAGDGGWRWGLEMEVGDGGWRWVGEVWEPRPEKAAHVLVTSRNMTGPPSCKQ